MWVKGRSTTDDNPPYVTMPAIYNSTEIFSTENWISGRARSLQIQINESFFLVIGGFGYIGSTNSWDYVLNDIWIFKISGNGLNSSKNFECLELIPYQKSSHAVYSSKSYSSDNIFGGRTYSNGWSLSDDEIMFFGGNGYNDVVSDSTIYYLADIWMFKISSKKLKYTRNDSPNAPPIFGNYRSTVSDLTVTFGGRDGPLGLKLDSFHAFLFGGGLTTNNGQLMRDCFLLSFSDSSFTWIFGENNTNYGWDTPTLVKGTKGVFDEKNSPDVRSHANGWVARGLVYLGGGYSGWHSQRSDFWKANVSIENPSIIFAWLVGTTAAGRSSVSMNDYEFDSRNYPGSRQGFNVILLSESEVLLYGGYGFPLGDDIGYLDDFWILNLDFEQWKFTGGSLDREVSHNGSLFESSSYNFPEARQNAVMMKAAPGVVILMLGEHHDGPVFNDLNFVSITTCQGKTSFNDNVCSSNGLCYADDSCFCFKKEKSTLHDCSNSCFGVSSLDISVCSGHGACALHDYCNCSEYYSGEKCSTFSCFEIDSNSSQVCNGHGYCASHDVCICENTILYDSQKCAQTNFLLVLILCLSLSSAGIILFLSTAICFFFIIFFVCLKNKKELKKFSELENIDILLEEQKLSKSTSVAHFQVNTDLFKIKFEDLKLEKIIGEGNGGASVYSCIWKQQKCAFKMFKINRFDEEKYKIFEKETQLLASLHHPFILRFLGAVVEENRVGFLMELGISDLETFLLKYRRDFKEEYPFTSKLKILYQISTAMEYLHSISVMHRDLKPKNVLMTENEESRITDFGTAKFSRISSNTSEISIATMTTKVGTEYFIAPEIISGKYDLKCDVFSFGMLYFVVLTEKWNPFGNEFYSEMRILSDPNFRPKFPPEFKESHMKRITRMWSSDPKIRPPFSEISSDLKKLVDGESSDLSGRRSLSVDKIVKDFEKKVLDLTTQVQNLTNENKNLKNIIQKLQNK